MARPRLPPWAEARLRGGPIRPVHRRRPPTVAVRYGAADRLAAGGRAGRYYQPENYEEARMRTTRAARRDCAWVVYRVGIKGGGAGPVAVCEQPDWEELDRAQPGVHTLLSAGLATEAAADRLARGLAEAGARPATRPPAGEVEKLGGPVSGPATAPAAVVPGGLSDG